MHREFHSDAEGLIRVFSVRHTSLVKGYYRLLANYPNFSNKQKKYI
jgi:hypothetical protein